MADNTWDIKITEVKDGFNFSLSRNEKHIYSSKKSNKTFNEALSDISKVVAKVVENIGIKNKYANRAKQIFDNAYIKNGMFDGIYESKIDYDSSGEATLLVYMDMDNDKLLQIVPDRIIDPQTRLTYNIVKQNSDI